MSFDVLFSPEADEDPARLFDFMLNKAETLEELDLADSVMAANRSAVVSHLAATPYSFRKAGRSPTRRELIIPFGVTGYVVLYEIASQSTVLVLTLRHQREEDYH